MHAWMHFGGYLFFFLLFFLLAMSLPLKMNARYVKQGNVFERRQGNECLFSMDMFTRQQVWSA